MTLPRHLARENTIFDWVDIDRMFIDRYGRPLSEPKVVRLAAKWNTQKCAPLLLSYRDDQDMFAILDGGHRREAARRNNATKLPCYIHLDLTYEQEADLYLAYATVHQQTAMDKFRARIEGREPHALAIQRICRGQGIQISLTAARSDNHDARYINAVAAVEKVYRLPNGPLVLAEALRICDLGMFPNRGCFDSQVLLGMGFFVARYQDHTLFKSERLIERLKRVGAHGLIQRANALMASGVRAGNTGGIYGQTLLAIYNSGLRLERQLPEWASYLPANMTPEERSERAQRAWTTRIQQREASQDVKPLDSDTGPVIG